MWPDRVSNPGPLALVSDALPAANQINKRVQMSLFSRLEGNISRILNGTYINLNTTFIKLAVSGFSDILK